MFSDQAARWLARRGVHYAWLIIAITFLTMLIMSAALGLPGAMLKPLGDEFGWTTEEISSPLAIRFALYGLMGPFAAVLIERFGLRTVICAGLALVGSGMAIVTQATELWQLFILWSLMLGLGTGMTAMVLGAVVANRWFMARRGLAVGILTASAATGQLVFLPFATMIIERWGWRMAVAPVFVVCLLIALLALLFMRDRPEDLGLLAYGETQADKDLITSPALPMTFRTPFVALREAAGNRTFWILAATFFICGLSTNGLLQTHFISLCSDNGLGPLPAASVLAAMGAFDFFGTIISGWLSDRYDNRKLLFWYYGLRGISLIWLPYSGFTLIGLGVFAMFYGLDWIATVPPTVKLAGSTFGAQRAGLLLGWIFAAHQLGAATAAWGAGLSRTLWLTYTPALLTAGGACLLAALLAMMIRRPAPRPV